jgi:cytochrome P450
MTIERTSYHHPRRPGDPELVDDPYGGGRFWLVTRHEDVSAVLTDRRFAINSASLPGQADGYADVLARMGISADLIPYLTGNLVHLDPPDHTRLRRLVSSAFSARRIAALRPRVEAITEELLDTLPGAAMDGTVDLIETFAFPLPITVICELLGVPAADRPQWRGWSRDCTSLDPRRMEPTLTAVSAQIRDLAARRRAEPADDLITDLTQVHDQDDDRLSDTELVTMVLTLMIAGHETTAHLIINGVATLLTHPEQLALLRDDPSLMPGAVQELLRWCGPATTAMPRYAMEDVTIADTRISRGETVQALLSTANHDPACFEAPDSLDVTRRADGTAAQHLGYSRGAHYCLGAGLANQEAEVAFTALLRRYPGLALAVPADQLQWKPLPYSRQLTRLPVMLGTPA